MSYSIWPGEPALKTTGVVDRLTKRLVYDISSYSKSFPDFVEKWKVISPKESVNLYYGKIYGVKHISPNHLILRTRKRGGAAYHYIDCKYQDETACIEMEIRSPNSSAYFYALWPLFLLSLFFIFADKSSIEFSILNITLGLLYSGIALAIGIFFLDQSIDMARLDVINQMKLLTGLSPVEASGKKDS